MKENVRNPIGSWQCGGNPRMTKFIHLILSILSVKALSSFLLWMQLLMLKRVLSSVSISVKKEHKEKLDG